MLAVLGPEDLFLRDLEELDQLEESHSDYDCLRIAGILRRLLLDDVPLVHLVNRERKIQIRFRVNFDKPGESIIVPGRQGSGVLRAQSVSMGDALDPEVERRIATSTLKLEKLLGRPVATARGKDVSARELIKYAANVAGGVHKGSPRSDKERAIEELAEKLLHRRLVRRADDEEYISSLLTTVRALGRVIRRGLRPVEEEIRAERTEEA